MWPVEHSAAGRDDRPGGPPVGASLFTNSHDVAWRLFEGDLSSLELFDDAQWNERANMLPHTDEAAPTQEVFDLLEYVFW
jgi:hypothetical protein